MEVVEAVLLPEKEEAKEAARNVCVCVFCVCCVCVYVCVLCVVVM